LKQSRTRVSLLNARSIRPQFEHIKMDSTLEMSDAICLTETWLWNDEDKSKFQLDGFKVHHNCAGRGKGVSVYYKESKFAHKQDVTEEQIQITKLTGKNFELISVYKAPKGNDSELKNHFKNMIDLKKPTLVCGDFNMCYIESKRNQSTTYLLQNGFKQIVREATHIEGGHIDHVYLRTDESLSATVEIYSPYYTAKDHDAICVSFPETEE
jgi:exonuclease III